MFDYWAADQVRRRSPGRDGVAVLDNLLTTPIALRSLLRTEIEHGEAESVELTKGQFHVLNMLRGRRRAAISGGAGTGKTMLAAEKARRFAREGFETLLVCFNQPLARLLADEVADAIEATGRLTVSTFHQLCEDLGREAGTLPPRPDPIPQAWWDETLPSALLSAIERLGPRFHAIVVDEGQDFATDWFDALQLLLHDPREDVLYVFHDPGQAIYRDDVVAAVGLDEYELDLNCRNTQPTHDFVRRFAPAGELASEALRSGGRAPELIAADTEATLGRCGRSCTVCGSTTAYHRGRSRS